MNVPTITIGEEPTTAAEELKALQEREVRYQRDNKELKDQVCALRAENEELREQNKKLGIRCEEILARQSQDSEKAYLRGRIEGLEFAVRCNGVSGAEVR